MSESGPFAIDPCFTTALTDALRDHEAIVFIKSPEGIIGVHCPGLHGQAAADVAYAAMRMKDDGPSIGPHTQPRATFADAATELNKLVGKRRLQRAEELNASKLKGGID